MKNQFEYQSIYFTDEYMMEADYDMALMMKDDCINQLMALRTLQSVMLHDETLHFRERVRNNLKAAQADIDHYESVHGKPKGSLESTI
jgi:hypothetical protein